MAANSYAIGSVLRALEILECLANHGGAGRVSDVAKRIHCSKNTAFRLLKTLQGSGFVRQASDSSYELTFKLLDLGESVLRNTELHTIARPYLQELVSEFGETVSLAVLDGDQIVYAERVLGRQPYHTSYSIGSRACIHATALGKAILANSPKAFVDSVLRAGLKRVTERTIIDPERLLADLRATVKRGYAIDNQENVFGIRCVGAPIFNRDEGVVAAISVSALAARLTDGSDKAIAASLVFKAQAISSRLGYSKDWRGERNERPARASSRRGNRAGGPIDRSVSP